MYLEAIRNIQGLFPNGPSRTIHLSFVPDEETGGERGMRCLAESPKFAELFPNLGLVLDEGISCIQQLKNEGFPSNTDDIFAFYTERVQR